MSTNSWTSLGEIFIRCSWAIFIHCSWAQTHEKTRDLCSRAVLVNDTYPLGISKLENIFWLVPSSSSSSILFNERYMINIELSPSHLQHGPTHSKIAHKTSTPPTAQLRPFPIWKMQLPLMPIKKISNITHLHLCNSLKPYHSHFLWNVKYSISSYHWL